MKKELVERELNPLLDQASLLKIKDTESLSLATEYLSQMNKVIDKIDLEKNKIIRPALNIINEERNRWRSLETRYEKVVTYLRNNISIYQTKIYLDQKNKTAKVADQLLTGKITTEKAIEIIKKTTVVENLKTENGSLSFREDKVLKIVDIDLIPKKYWIIDETKLFTDLKAGTLVKGATLEVKMTPINRRS